MATTIVTKNSSTAAAVPTAGQLVQGELAVNVADKRLFTEDNGGTIVEVGTNPSAEIIANGGIALPDNGKATFGAADDLEIYHDGSNSYVSDVGTGRLFLSSNGDGVNIVTNTGENLIRTDSADGRVRLYFDNEEKMRTNATGINVTGNVALGDNDKATFGASDDLQIYHDGSSSYVEDAGSGNLILKSNGANIQFRDTSDNIIFKASPNATTLYYAASQKLATTNTGIDVTGEITADGLVVDDGGALIKDAGADAILTLQRTGSVTSGAKGAVGWKDSSDLYVSSIQTATNGSDNRGSLFFRTSDDSTGNTSPYDPSKRMAISSNGDISFYEDTGTTAKLFWDASAESLGIGTSSPSATLEVDNGAEGEYFIAGGDNASNGRSIRFTSSTSSAGSNGALHTIKANSTAGELAFANGNGNIMYLDSSGNVGIGTSSPDYPLHVSNTLGYPVLIERTNGNDAGIRFKDLNTTDADSVRIGSDGDGFRIITGGSTSALIDSSGHAIIPAGVTLGTAAGVYNAAKTLDDYEEGDATGITCTGSTSGSATVVINNAKYTKTGNVVNLYLYLTMDFSGDDIVGDIEITNLPFSNANNNLQNVSIIHQTISGTYLTLGARVTSNSLRVQTNSTSSGLARADCVNSANRVMMIGATYNTDA